MRTWLPDPAPCPSEDGVKKDELRAYRIDGMPPVNRHDHVVRVALQIYGNCDPTAGIDIGLTVRGLGTYLSESAGARAEGSDR